MKTKIRKILLALIVSLLILSGVGYAYLQSQTYQPSPQAQKIYQQAQPQEITGATLYQGQKDQPVFIFYIGALVDPKAYAALGKTLAEQGYSTYIFHSPLNLPILDQSAAKNLIAKEKLENRTIYLGGHSLGGVVASRAAKELGSTIKGLVLLASYPDSKTDLSQTPLAVLSLTADQDQVLKWPVYQANKKLLPTSTIYTNISGGNHAGFGLYGPQKGDGKATISATNQQELVTQTILAFLKQEY